jgi:hypothetical protein
LTVRANAPTPLAFVAVKLLALFLRLPLGNVSSRTAHSIRYHEPHPACDQILRESM